jgi:hypothetical protein
VRTGGPLSIAERCEVFPGVAPRRLLVPWLCAELLATSEAIERIRAWFASDRPERAGADFPNRVRYHGDEELLPAVWEAFMAMAPPARDFVADTTVLLGCGWSRAGWAGGTLGPHRSVIVLSGGSRDQGTIRDLAWHEAAHCFLEAHDRPCATTARELATCSDLASTDDGRRAIDDYVKAVEARAVRLAASWRTHHEDETCR